MGVFRTARLLRVSTYQLFGEMLILLGLKVIFTICR
jgi:hypothetical protein